MKFLLLHGFEEYEEDKTLIHNICRGEDGKQYNITVDDFEPYFYAEVDIDHDKVVKIEDSKIKSYDGKDLYKIFVEHPSDIPSVRKEVNMHYEADIKFPMRFRYDKGIKSYFEIKDYNGEEIVSEKQFLPIEEDININPHSWCVDIETWDVGGFVGGDEASVPIMSIAVKDEETGKYAVFIHSDQEVKLGKVERIFEEAFDIVVPKLRLFVLKDEKEMLERFWEAVDRQKPDAMYGWNYKDFDAPFILNRSRKLGISVSNHHMNFDAQYAYVKLSENKLDSKKLDDIAKKELKKNKIPREKIHEMYVDNIEKLIAYNIGDVYLTSEIAKKRNLIGFHMAMAKMAGTDLMCSTTNGLLVDSLFMHMANGDMILPSGRVRRVQGIDGGGKVQDAITGIVEYVAGVDLNKAYPTALIDCNMSPETLLGYMCDICKNDCNGKNVEIIYTEDGSEVKEHRCEQFKTDVKHCKVPSGRCYRTDKDGIIKKALKFLLDLRGEYQKKEKEYLESGDKEKEKIYFEMSFAAKKITNTMYGVLGNIDSDGRAIFRLADGRIGSDTTHIIRLLIGWIGDHINDLEKLKKYCETDEEKLFLDMLINYQNVTKKVFGDTDSVGFTTPFNEIVKETGDRENMIKLLFNLEHLLNKSFVDFGKEYTSGGGNHNVEFEKYYKTFFQGGAKKKYAGVYLWKKGVWTDDWEDEDKIEVRGYETRRSDWSSMCKDMQEKLLRQVLIDKMTEKEFGRIVRKWKKQFYAGEYNVTMKWGKTISTWTSEGDLNKNGKQKPKTIQQRSGEYAEKHFGLKFEKGDKPFMCYIKKIKNGPKLDVMAFGFDDDPSDTCEIDYDFMWEKQVVGPLSRIVDGLGWSWNYIESGKKQKSLNKFF